ncbi:hypothetical protein ACFE04_031024 [Oxalis oulophora]
MTIGVKIHYSGDFVKESSLEYVRGTMIEWPKQPDNFDWFDLMVISHCQRSKNPISSRYQRPNFTSDQIIETTTREDLRGPTLQVAELVSFYEEIHSCVADKYFMDILRLYSAKFLKRILC